MGLRQMASVLLSWIDSIFSSTRSMDSTLGKVADLRFNLQSSGCFGTVFSFQICLGSARCCLLD